MVIHGRAGKRRLVTSLLIFLAVSFSAQVLEAPAQDSGASQATVATGPATSVGTTPADRFVTVGDFFNLVPSDAAGSADGGSPSTSGTEVTLDVLQDDVEEYSDELCKQVDTASRDDIDALKEEYADFRREEEANIDQINKDEEALDQLRRELDAEADRLDDWNYQPPDDQRLQDADKAVTKARKELSKLQTARRTVMDENTWVLNKRRELKDASARLRAANAEIARLTDEQRRRESGELSADKNLVGRLGAAAANLQHIQRVSEDLQKARAKREAALQAAGHALFMPRAPKDIAEIGAKASSLHDKWQALRDQLNALDAKIVAAEADEKAAVEAKARAQDALRASRREDLIQAKRAQARKQDAYRARGEEWVVKRTIALLSFQLYSNVTDCIARREAEIKKGETKAAAADPTKNQYVRGTITDSCYGPTKGPHVAITGAFDYMPEWWRPLGLIVTPEREVKLNWIIYLAVHPDDMPDPPGMGRVKMQADGSFSLKVVDPNPQNVFQAPAGQPAKGSADLIRTPYPPFVVKGRLVPDPSAPDGWVGQGTGAVMYRRVEDSTYMFIHRGEPCRITWTVP